MAMQDIARDSRENAGASPFASNPTIVPLLFVVLWSSGYIGGVIGLQYGEPFTMTLYRFGSASLILLAAAFFFKAPWPSTWKQAGHIAMVGLLIQATQFASLYSGMKVGVPAAVTALIIGTMPICTAIGAGIFLGEKTSYRQWIGLFLGLIGLTLVVLQGLTFDGVDPIGYALVGLGLFGITSGTLYQKKFCSTMDLRTGGFIQLGVAAVVMLILAESFETMVSDWTPAFIGSVAWLSIMNSIGAISLMYLMLRRGEASKVASLFFLIPPTTAVMATLILGDDFTPLELTGFGVTVAGVYLATRR